MNKEVMSCTMYNTFRNNVKYSTLSLCLSAAAATMESPLATRDITGIRDIHLSRISLTNDFDCLILTIITGSLTSYNYKMEHRISI